MGPTGPPRLDRVEAPSRLVLGVAAGNVRRRIKGLSIRYAHVADWADWGPCCNLTHVHPPRSRSLAHALWLGEQRF